VGRSVRSPHPCLRGAGPALKILDLTEFFSETGGGVGTYLRAKARWCAARDDVEHVLVAPARRSARRTWHGSNLYEIGGPRAWSPGYHVLLGARRLRDILERERPDVIELGSIYLAPWVLRVATRGAPIPTVGYFHMDLAGAVLRTLARRWPRAARAAMRAAIDTYLRSAYARCHSVVGASDASLKAMADAGIAERRLAPFGVDLDVFRPDARDPAWKVEAGAHGQPVALFVGRLTIEKNLPVIVNALPELHRRFGLKLVLIGHGGWRAGLEALARTHPERLAVLPYESDRARLARAYASADLYIAPSPHETFGLAAIEAAACGLPIVGAGAGALDERLAGASWARTVPAGDPRAWADAVGDLLAADRAAVGAAARASAADYSWDRTFGTLLGIYQEAIEARGGRDRREGRGVAPFRERPVSPVASGERPAVSRTRTAPRPVPPAHPA
jgi:alpha-1,6-mannosyltransferase